MSSGEVDPEAFALFRQHGAEAQLETARAVEAHFAAQGLAVTHIGQPPLVEQLFVHVDVHLCPPTPKHPYVTLFTSGMSDLPQSVPPERDDCRFAELMMQLPPDWTGLFDELTIVEGGRPVGRAAGSVGTAARPPALAWPIASLLGLARYPHASGAWLGPGHLVPTGEPEPLLGSGFTGFVLLEPLGIPWEVRGPAGKRIALHAVVPLYPEEIELKRRRGTVELMRRLAEAELGHIADPARTNVAADPGNGGPARLLRALLRKARR